MPVRPDYNIANVPVELFMPLCLQLASKQAGVGPAIKLRALLLRQLVSATVNATGMPCRSECMREAFQRQTHLTNQTA
jgi:hypothetical protein